MKSQVWAIVLNWNNYYDICECIESIHQSTIQVAKILLVDNGSNDGSIERLKNKYLNDPNIHIICNESNFGFARGVNVGVQYALNQGAKLIMLVNNDAIIDSACIQELTRAIELNPKVGIVGPRIFYYSDPTRVWQGGGHYSRLKTGVICPEKSKDEMFCLINKRYVTFLTGCVVLIRRQVFEEVGLFDEKYYFYGEDVDFCLRASKAGFKLLYVPSAKAWHKIKAISKDRTSPFTLYHLARSRIIVLRKNFPSSYFLYGLIIHFLAYTPFRVVQIINGTRSLKSLFAWFQGTWAGIRSN